MVRRHEVEGERVTWARLVQLARQVEREHADGASNVETVLRLARAVMSFQERLLGDGRRPQVH